MNRLNVFIGKPGSGKTSIIKKLFPNKTAVDVYPFVIALHDGVEVTDQAALEGYDAMYKHLLELDEQEVILELGTNHPELNVSEVKKLTKTYFVSVFLLEADKDTCRSRVHSRGLEMWSEKGLERRLERDFPNSYISLLEENEIHYHVIDTNVEFSKTTSEVVSIINNQ